MCMYMDHIILKPYQTKERIVKIPSAITFFRKFDFWLSLLFLCNFLKTACEKLLRKQLPNLKV